MVAVKMLRDVLILGVRILDAPTPTSILIYGETRGTVELPRLVNRIRRITSIKQGDAIEPRRTIGGSFEPVRMGTVVGVIIYAIAGRNIL